MHGQFRKVLFKLFPPLLGLITAYACSSSESGGGLRGGAMCSGPQDCASRICTSGACVGDAPSAGGASGGVNPNGSLPGSSCSQASDCLSGKCTNGVCESSGSLPNTNCTTGPDCASGICVSGTCQIPGSASDPGAGGPGAGMHPCMAGALGCPCQPMNKCKAGLTCMGATCCDSKTMNCTAPTTGGGQPVGQPGGGVGGAGNPSTGASACAPGVVGPVITECGYPYASNNPLTNIYFNESECLAAIAPSGGYPFARIQLYYSDEHAMTLGVRETVINGVSTTYDVSPLTSNPGVIESPKTGTNQITGQQAGVDPSGRPMWPALFITDITNNPTAVSGDWQWGGAPINPTYVAGTWKGAVRTVDANGAAITPDADPAKNSLNLGNGQMPPNGVITMPQGYTAEVRWDLRLETGHNYRFQVMVHDGDQNKVGGDTGEACITFCAGSACPTGVQKCSTAADCSNGYSCVGGCCIPPPPPPPPPPDGGTCPPNWEQYIQTEGRKICTPPPMNGECPPGYVITIQNNVQYCTPVEIR